MIRDTLTGSVLALALIAPAQAQQNTSEERSGGGAGQDVNVLRDWSYDPLYASGWSVENLMDEATVYGPDGDEVGTVEDIIFRDNGEALALIAEVGGLWDIGDTHVSVPWNEVEIFPKDQSVTIPVTEDSVSDYGLDFSLFGNQETYQAREAADVETVKDELEAGPNVFMVSDMIGDYANLAQDEPYGMVRDVIVTESAISAIVIDATTYYGTPGYYAFPYSDYPAWQSQDNSYDLEYSESDIETLESFDYDRLDLGGSNG